MDFDFDDALLGELEKEETAKTDKPVLADSTLGVATNFEGERVASSNESIRERLMESLKLKTFNDQDKLSRENEVHNTKFSLSEQSNAVELDEDEFAQLIDSELSEIARPVNQTLVKSMNLDDDLPSIERVTLNEFILIEGTYTSVFEEFIKNDKAIPKGPVPLCVRFEQEGVERIVVVKEIQATPDVLFRLKYFLEGFKFNRVVDGEFLELDIYHYLGKFQIQEQE